MVLWTTGGQHVVRRARVAWSKGPPDRGKQTSLVTSTSRGSKVAIGQSLSNGGALDTIDPVLFRSLLIMNQSAVRPRGPTASGCGTIQCGKKALEKYAFGNWKRCSSLGFHLPSEEDLPGGKGSKPTANHIFNPV